MKTSELRRGNAVMHKGNIIIIDSILPNMVNYNPKTKKGIPIEEIEPVPIPYGNPWKLMNKIMPTNFVHEIQNSYFYLKGGEEIDLKEFGI